MRYFSMIFAIALMAGTASADNVFNFHYNNNNAFYSCHYAENQVANTLVTLGADNVETRCHGGIDHDQLLPVSVSATYTQVAKGEREVVFKGNESCDFNVKLIKAALKNFDHEVVSAQSSCWDAKGRYNIRVLVR